jgi:hypothetical protein
LQFFDGDNQMKTTLGLTEFALNAMTLGACPTKRYTSHDEELEKVSDQS